MMGAAWAASMVYIADALGYGLRCAMDLFSGALATCAVCECGDGMYSCTSSFRAASNGSVCRKLMLKNVKAEAWLGCLYTSQRTLCLSIRK